MTYTEARELLARRKRAKGSKKAAITRQLTKQIDTFCDTFKGNVIANCRGCKLYAAMQAL